MIYLKSKGIKSMLLIAFASMIFIPFESVSALIESPKTLGDLRANYNELLKQKQDNDNMTAEAKAEIAAKEAAVKQAEADIHQAEADMEQAQKDIEESNERIEELKVNASDVLLYLQQMKGTNAYVEYVSGATTMTDMIMRIAAIEQLSNQIHGTIGDLEAEIKRNEELKVELEQKKKDLEAQSVEYKKIIEENYGKLENYNKYAISIEDQLDNAQARLNDYLDKCSSKVGSTADDVLLTSCSSVPLNSGWLKPLNYGTITSEVGYRWGSYHNALDIGGASPFEGTPIYAAAAGEVAGIVERSSCGGNMVFINVVVGGKEYVTYYFHLLDGTINVKVGDIVDQGTVIGKVGGYSTSTLHGGYDECTTGAHLHFGVANGFFTGYSPGPSTTIIPPGFPNSYGWSFYSRTDMY